jgi:hypothetical protein
VALDFARKEDPADTKKLEMASQVMTIAVLPILINDPPFGVVDIYIGGPHVLSKVVPSTQGSAANSLI